MTGLVVLVVGLLAYAAESHTLYTSVDEELRHAAERVAGVHGAVASAGQPHILAASARAGLVVWLYSAGGEVLAASPNTSLAPAIDPRAAIDGPPRPPYDRIVRFAPPYTTVDAGAGRFGLVTGMDGSRWRTYILPLVGSAAATGTSAVDGATGFAVAAMSLSEVDATVAASRRLVPLLALVGASVMLAAGALLASRALRPIAALTETAGAIARARDLDRRVPISDRHDELGQLAVTFNAMLDSLEQAYRAQQRFIADASHELRTPLTAIQANLELLERQPEMSVDDRREAVREASRETRRLVRLVGNLLALARADAGVNLVRQRVELDRVLLDAFAQARHLAGGHQLAIEQVVPLTVEGDPDQLKQLLLILLDNALKYTPAGGTVTLALRRAGDTAEMTVRDTGVGIPPEALPHVFERFYRSDYARTCDPAGTGLGLAIARWIATQHDGDVVLSSWPGRGTTATVHLPLARGSGSRSRFRRPGDRRALPAQEPAPSEQPAQPVW